MRVDRKLYEVFTRTNDGTVRLYWYGRKITDAEIHTARALKEYRNATLCKGGDDILRIA